MRTPGAARASAMSASSAVMRLTRTPAGRSTLNSVTVGPATHPTTSAMIVKLSSVSCRHAAVSLSSASQARSFFGLFDVESMSIGGSSNPSAGRGAASGAAEEALTAAGAPASPAPLPRVRPSLRVSVCGASPEGWSSSGWEARLKRDVRAAAKDSSPSAAEARPLRGSTLVSPASRASPMVGTTGTLAPDERLIRENGGAASTSASFSSSARSARASCTRSTSFERDRPITARPAAATPTRMMHDTACPNRERPAQAMPAPT